MSTLKTNNIEHLDASTPSIQTTIGGGVVFAGLSTFQGNAQFDGNVNIAGTVTYDDVTNIDSVGIVTAQSGLNVGPKTGIACTISSAGAITAAGSVVSNNYMQVNGTDGSSSFIVNSGTTPKVKIYPEYLVGGTNLDSGDTIKLNFADGSITGTGNFSTGGSIISEANPETSNTTNGAMLDKVKVIARNATGQSVWLGYVNGTSATTSSITADGQANFSQRVFCNQWFQSDRTDGTNSAFYATVSGVQKLNIRANGSIDAEGRADIGSTSLDDYAIAGFTNSGTYGGIYSQNNNTGGSLYVGQANSTEVFKVTATGQLIATGDAYFGAKYTNGTGVLIQDYGEVAIRGDTAGDRAFTIFNAGNAASDITAQITAGGSATFTGGVKIGGTAAANQIDEYEEGTWTPTAGSSMAINSGTWAANGYYTKIGNVVTVEIKQTSGTVSWALGGLIIGGCPFTPAGSTGATGCLTNTGPNISMNVLQWSSGNIYAPEAATSQTTLRINMTFLV
jgi:hypothetical protein